MMSEIEEIDAAGPQMWTVTRCGHGCLHVHLGRCSVTLSAEEFQTLRALLQRASAELGLDGQATGTSQPH